MKEKKNVDVFTLLFKNAPGINRYYKYWSPFTVNEDIIIFTIITDTLVTKNKKRYKKKMYT